MQGRATQRLSNVLTVKGHVVTKNYLDSNIGWLLVEDLSKWKHCTYFELYKGVNKYVVKNAF